MNRNDRRIAMGTLLIGLLALIGYQLAGSDAAPFVEAKNTPPITASPQSHRPAYHHAAANYYHAAANYHYQSADTYRPERFPFDPNTADSTQLLRLGLRPWQVRNIYKYRSAGGIYRKKEDFARLYGLTVKQYRELEPYIRIAHDYQPAATLVGEQQPPTRDTLRYPVKIKEDEHVVLNTADTTLLKRVPGIGSYYARQIVRHGQRLGGYVSVDQLNEINGFPQDAKKYFAVQQHPDVRKLNVNQLTLEQLRLHPYINFYQAKAITDYRRLHGNISSLDELRLCKDFTPEAIERLRPYVAY